MDSRCVDSAIPAQPLCDGELMAISAAGDSFWKDSGQFVGGFIAGFSNSYSVLNGTPIGILNGCFTSGLIAASR